MAGELVLDFNYDILDELNLTGHDNISLTSLNADAFSCPSSSPAFNMQIFTSAFYLLVFLLALPGNLLVSLVVWSTKQRLTPSDLYLFHLAVADLLLALSLPLWAVAVLRGWVFGRAACKATCALLEVNFYTSILFLVCISVDRFLSVTRAADVAEGAGGFRSWAGPGRRWGTYGVCAGVWAFGLLIALPSWFLSDVLADRRGVDVCAEQFGSDNQVDWRLTTRLLRHLLGFLLPLAAMLVCYGAALLRLLRARGGLHRLRAMRVIAAVVAAFLLCWCPYHVAVMADTVMRAELLPSGCVERHALERAEEFTLMLALLHCCVNPVLYAFVGVKFRRNLRRMLQRGKAGIKKSQLERPGATRLFSRSSSNASQDGSIVLM